MLRILPDETAGALPERVREAAFANSCNAGVGFDGDDVSAWLKRGFGLGGA